ncbi:hypothetical protein QWY22_10730 [Planococcus liqunii]|uniref:hypothetical protein n=1 Tax=Planococcus liqunii TaxID=3058394 RepID=UPI00260A37B0|nr:hypothetical protein [Planococcus sp. N056]WKA49381.1 hypothetical protein QWY22_10730 [Planococcus sp. N056]
MFTWNYFDWGEGIEQGLTAKGFPYYEVEIKGWNDDQEYTDLEKLIVIKVINTYSSVEVKMNFLHPDARRNFTARKMAKETKKYLIDAIKSDLI